MAASEADFQTELLKAFQKMGWHAFKVAKLSFGGVPDIYVKAPGYPSVWLELKYGRLNLSPLQRQWMKKEQKAGGKVGWAVCEKIDREWHLYMGTDPDVVLWRQGTWVQTRGVGEPWHVHNILHAIAGDGK